MVIFLVPFRDPSFCWWGGLSQIATQSGDDADDDDDDDDEDDDEDEDDEDDDDDAGK